MVLSSSVFVVDLVGPGVSRGIPRGLHAPQHGFPVGLEVALVFRDDGRRTSRQRGVVGAAADDTGEAAAGAACIAVELAHALVEARQAHVVDLQIERGVLGVHARNHALHAHEFGVHGRILGLQARIVDAELRLFALVLRGGRRGDLKRTGVRKHVLFFLSGCGCVRGYKLEYMEFMLKLEAATAGPV